MKKSQIYSLIIIAVLLHWFCGKKGPVLPPVKKIPQEVNIIEAFQRGEKIILKWENPTSYLDGSPLANISSTDIWIYKKPYEEGEEKAVDLKIFTKNSTLLKSIQNSELIKFKEDPNEETPILVYDFKIKPSEYKNTLFFLGIKAADKKRKESHFSKIVCVEPRVAPHSPLSLKAEGTEKGVRLDWDPPDKNTDGSSPAEVKGYNLYRSRAEGKFERVNDELITQTWFEDQTVVVGETYRYFVRSTASGEGVLLESEDSDLIEINIKDFIPPEKPKGLVLIADKDRITLTWDQVEDPDLQGYKVWRREKGEKTFIQITSGPIEQNIFHDFSPEKGKVYEYCVSACDKAGNESPKSDSIQGALKGL